MKTTPIKTKIENIIKELKNTDIERIIQTGSDIIVELRSPSLVSYNQSENDPDIEEMLTDKLEKIFENSDLTLVNCICGGEKGYWDINIKE